MPLGSFIQFSFGVKWKRGLYRSQLDRKSADMRSARPVAFIIIINYSRNGKSFLSSGSTSECRAG